MGILSFAYAGFRTSLADIDHNTSAHSETITRCSAGFSAVVGLHCFLAVCFDIRSFYKPPEKRICLVFFSTFVNLT